LLLAYLHFPLSNGYLIVEVLDYSVLPCFILFSHTFNKVLGGVGFIIIYCVYAMPIS